MRPLAFIRVGVVAGLLMAVVSCQRESEPRQSPRQAVPSESTNSLLAPPPPANGTNAAASTNEQMFLVKGVIKEVMPEQKKVRITHEEIPNYMQAMTMVFEVKEARELARIKPGDTVRFRMIVTETDGWIDNIMKIEPEPGQAQAPETPIPEPFRRVREVEPLAVGDVMPDYQFTNQLGRPVRLHDFKGQVVAFSFVYTRCPFPTFCPRITGNMAAAHQRLKAMEDEGNGITNWHFLSITIDPDFDTPNVLASYARQYKADPEHWSFVTGPLIDITAIAEQFGLMFWRSDPTKPANIDHNLRTVVIGPDGHVKKIMTENMWAPKDLVDAVIEAGKS